MRIKRAVIKKQIGWHILFCMVVALLVFPILFAVSNSLKTMQDAFNTVFEIIPRSPTLENYSYVFDRLPLFRITINTFLIAAFVTAFKSVTSLLAA